MCSKACPIDFRHQNLTFRGQISRNLKIKLRLEPPNDLKLKLRLFEVNFEVSLGFRGERDATPTRTSEEKREELRGNLLMGGKRVTP